MKLKLELFDCPSVTEIGRLNNTWRHRVLATPRTGGRTTASNIRNWIFYGVFTLAISWTIAIGIVWAIEIPMNWVTATARQGIRIRWFLLIENTNSSQQTSDMHHCTRVYRPCCVDVGQLLFNLLGAHFTHPPAPYSKINNEREAIGCCECYIKLLKCKLMVQLYVKSYHL